MVTPLRGSGRSRYPVWWQRQKHYAGGDPAGMAARNGRRSRTARRLSPAAWLYAGVVAAAAGCVTFRALSSGQALERIPGAPGDLIVLALLFAVCDSAPAALTSRQSAWSPSSSATLAAVVLL